MMVRKFVAASWILAFGIAAHAQDFNGRQGYIFKQPFVTRVSTRAASQLLGIVDIDQVFFDQYFKLGNQQYQERDGAMPSGVSRVGNTLVLEVPDKPALRLTDFQFKGKRDGADSQRFTYLMERATFHVLAVSFDHDRPCFMLVDKESLKVYFIDYDNL
ncbi:hypothetical protein KIK84_10765 [Curvibacter sp. CHRR-16]|uniref:hypothetical protein n=1 Tax=Curvibacter sp. CHRR-16 TaxID=2835872 RepID=UPI001BD96162|nr:hypothetical protein [Curvibacter sp. CHRR-16]MBT0570812.1 hypothetical protein [Curvibacter sp. CHRR-16]